jgi:hypothetical protein
MNYQQFETDWKQKRQIPLSYLTPTEGSARLGQNGSSELRVNELWDKARFVAYFV